ncbi:hypothetical protein B0H10DRAFT_930872 [Mycena sp. CBHHK59/15]|nr:hypothetical protein B0H10DRAFT_930872 [Mycena sp. CBHHK59/15]
MCRSPQRTEIPPNMAKSLFLAFFYAVVLTVLRPNIFYALAAVPAAESGLERRDILSFWATQNWLQYMANTFAQNTFGTNSGVPQLQVIANHIKNCSDAFDSATIQLATLIPAGQFSPKFSAGDASSLNTLFVPSTQGAILGNLHTLLYGKAFFEAVNGSPQMRIVICHWVGDLARQNDIFLSQISLAAPSTDYSTPWTALRTSAAAGYDDFLGNLNGFRCNGL